VTEGRQSTRVNSYNVQRSSSRRTSRPLRVLRTLLKDAILLTQRSLADLKRESRGLSQLHDLVDYTPYNSPFEHHFTSVLRKRCNHNLIPITSTITTLSLSFLPHGGRGGLLKMSYRRRGDKLRTHPRKPGTEQSYERCVYQ